MTDVKRNGFVKCGDHLFGCFDIEEDGLDVLSHRMALEGLRPVSFAYIDPPWSDRNCKYWRTIAGATQSLEAHPYIRLMGKIFDFLQQLDVPVAFIEHSAYEKRPMIDSVAKQHGFDPKRRWRVFYGTGKNRRPNYLTQYSVKDCFIQPFFNPSGHTGDDLVDYVFMSFAVKGGIVVDPCLGLGRTARIAHRYGMRCVGNEFNVKRLEKACQSVFWMK